MLKHIFWLTSCLFLTMPSCMTLALGNDDVDKELGRYENEAYQCLFNSDYAQAERWWAKAISLCEESRADQLVLATYLNSLGATQCLSGKLKEAETTLERALKIRREKHGDKKRETNSTMRNLAEVYIGLGRHKDAENLICLYHHYAKSDADGAPRRSSQLPFLGRLFLAAERYQDAEWCLQNAIDCGRKQKEDASVMSLYYRDLSLTYLGRNNAKESKNALDTAVALYPPLEDSLDRLYAEIFLLEGRVEEAERLLYRDMKKLEPNKAQYALLYAQDLALLTRTKIERKEFKEAEALFQSCLKLRESVLGDEHPLVAAVLEQQCKHLPKAPEGAAERARAIRKKAEAQKPLGLARRQAAGDLIFEGTKEVPK